MLSKMPGNYAFTRVREWRTIPALGSHAQGYHTINPQRREHHGS